MNLRRSTLVACAIFTAIASAAAAAPHAARPVSPDRIAVVQYPLTMDKIEKLAAAYKGIYKLAETDPSLRMESEDAPTIDAKVALLDRKYPKGTAVIHAAGLTTREYIVASVALFNDLSFVTMKKNGQIKAYPAGVITPENAAFVEKNFDKLTALAKSMSPPQPKESDD